jgi:hypothetical protein
MGAGSFSIFAQKNSSVNGAPPDYALEKSLTRDKSILKYFTKVSQGQVHPTLG